MGADNMAGWEGLTLDLVRGALEEHDFDELVRITYDALARTVRVVAADPLAQARGELIGEFCGDYVLRGAGRFWESVLSRCDTNAAVARYVRHCFISFCNKSIGADNFASSERAWFRKRLRILLRRPEFRHEPTPAGKVYGLAEWLDRATTRGVYRGEWTEFTAECERWPHLARQPVSERRGPYADDEVAGAVHRLMTVSQKFSPANILAMGVERFWVDVGGPDIVELQSFDGAQTASPAPMEVRETAELALSQLTDRQRFVLSAYTIPKSQTAPGHRTPTLSTLARQLGVSIETIRTEGEAALSRIREVFESQALSDEEHIACTRALIEICTPGI